MNFKKGWLRPTTAFGFLVLLFASSAFADQLAYRLRVDGLSCPFCAYGVEKKLGAVSGVQRVEVDIASGTVTVMMVEGAALDEASAKKAVKEAGFSLRNLEPIRTAPKSKADK